MNSNWPPYKYVVLPRL